MKNIIRYKKIVYILLILLLGFLAYSNTLHVPFHFDDKHNIVNNPLYIRFPVVLPQGRSISQDKKE